jgi:hypothetical protein
MRTTPLVLIAAFVFALGLPLLTGCTPSTGGGVTSEGYIAPATVSPIEATERMRSEYRDFR